MTSRQRRCSRCGATDEIQTEECPFCEQPLYDRAQFAHSPNQRPPVKKLSRRAALILGGAILLPIGGTAAYLIQQRLSDPHLLTYQFHGAAMAAAWSPDGTRVAVVGWVAPPTKWGTQALKVFNPSTGETLLTGDTDREVVSGLAPLDVVWSADGQQLVAFIGQGLGMAIDNGNRVIEMVQLWDASTGQRVRNFPVTQPITSQDYGLNLDIRAISIWTLCDQYLAVDKMKDLHPNGLGGSYSTLEIWEIATGSAILTQDMRRTGLNTPILIWSMQWAPDRRRLAVLTVNARQPADARQNLHVDIWDAPTKQKTQSFDVENALPGKLMWSPGGKSLAIGLDIYAIDTGNKIITYQVASQPNLEFMAWSPDEKYVLLRSTTYSKEGFRVSVTPSLIVLNASTNQELHTYDGREGKMIWSRSGDYFLVMAPNQGTLDVWKTFFWQ